MARRTNKRRPRDERRIHPAADREPPLSPDDYLTLDNTRAARSLPKELAVEADTQSVSIYAPGKSLDSIPLRKSREAPGAWLLEVPKGSGLGLPGRNGGRMSPAEVSRGIKGT